MTVELIALVGGMRMGLLTRAAAGASFAYDPAWREAPSHFPLSLSMPLAKPEHGPEVTEPFLWGLLPDNELILAKWAQRFQVSARNVFGLIANVGEDCAGAVQFVRAERLAAVLSGAINEVEWLSDRKVARRLRDLRADHAAWRTPRDTGQFSLAGAQPKTALLYQDGRWGIPSGRTPTTHILKPPTGEFDGHVENEHICLELARAAGLPTATSRIHRFEDEVAIVVERYDRVFAAPPAAVAGKPADTPLILRAHQEDICQALGQHPASKYQNEGGPGPAEIVRLLRMHSSEPKEDIDTFLDALAFNWLIGGSDAHAKNYSLLIGADGRVRLAPLYDLASALPYPEIDPQKIKLAMKIGGRYRLRDIGPRQWSKLAVELGLDTAAVLDRVLALAETVIEKTPLIITAARDAGLDHPIMKAMEEKIVKHARRCAGLLQAPAAT